MSQSEKYGAKREHTKFGGKRKGKMKGEMAATAEYVKRAAIQGADFNDRLPFTDLWLKMTVKATVEILGEDRIDRIDSWNQETKEGYLLC